MYIYIYIQIYIYIYTRPPNGPKEQGGEPHHPWAPGVIAWGDDGTGFVLQVTTPDWPGAGPARGSCYRACNG